MYIKKYEKREHQKLRSKRRKKRRQYIVKYYVKPNYVASLYYWLVYLIGEKEYEKIKFCRYLLDTKLFIPTDMTRKKITITFEDKPYTLDHKYFMRKKYSDDNPNVVRMINRKRKILKSLGYYDLIKDDNNGTTENEYQDKDETMSCEEDDGEYLLGYL